MKNIKYVIYSPLEKDPYGKKMTGNYYNDRQGVYVKNIVDATIYSLKKDALLDRSGEYSDKITRVKITVEPIKEIK